MWAGLAGARVGASAAGAAGAAGIGAGIGAIPVGAVPTAAAATAGRRFGRWDLLHGWSTAWHEANQSIGEVMGLKDRRAGI